MGFQVSHVVFVVVFFFLSFQLFLLLLILLPLFSVACNLSPGCQVSDPISKEDSGSCSEVFETTIPDNRHHTSIQPCGILSCFQTFAVLFWISMYLFSGVTFTGLLVTCCHQDHFCQDHFYHINATWNAPKMHSEQRTKEPFLGKINFEGLCAVLHPLLANLRCLPYLCHLGQRHLQQVESSQRC